MGSSHAGLLGSDWSGASLSVAVACYFPVSSSGQDCFAVLWRTRALSGVPAGTRVSATTNGSAAFAGLGIQMHLGLTQDGARIVSAPARQQQQVGHEINDIALGHIVAGRGVAP